MTASPAEPRYIQAFFAGAAVLVFAGIAAAQGTEPAEAPAALGRPMTLLPGQGKAGAPPSDLEPIARVETTGPEPPDGQIEVNRLDDIDLEAVGVLDARTGGLGNEMWRGSKRHVVSRLLARLPDQLDSAALRDLARRLLLSAATPPQDDRESGSGPANDLLRLRVERLAALGEVESLNRLLRVVPERYANEAIQKARVETYLLANDPDSACNSVRNAVAGGLQSLYWQKAMVFCQIHAGEMNGAALGVDLLREQELSDETGFIALAEALSTGTLSDVPVVGDPSVFELSMLQRFDLPVTPAASVEDRPGLLYALAGASGVEIRQRIKAAERAVSGGTMPAKRLARLYGIIEFAAEDLAAAPARALELEEPRNRALLFQAAMGAADSRAQATIIQAALDAADSPPAYRTAIRLYEPLLLAISPAPDLAGFAGTAGRALFALGRYDRAESWIDLARQEALVEPAAAAAITMLWPYARLAGSRAFGWDGNLTSWQSAHRDKDPVTLGQWVTFLQTALSALGESRPLDWSELAATAEDQAGVLPDASILYALESAGDGGRVGETVLLSLLAIGRDGPGAAHPIALERVLVALRQVGLEREARAIAIEAAIALGI